MKVLLEDTRNPATKHTNVHQWAQDNGVTIIRTKLLVGDYTLPTDQSRCVDTKYGMQEVYSNLVQEHERFRSECELAQKAGVLLIILVEEGGMHGLTDVQTWKNPRRERWFRLHAAHKAGKLLKVAIPKVPPLPSDRLFTMMHTMEERYGVEWKFCGKDRTGAVIWELLNDNSVYSRINGPNLDGGK